MRFGKKILLLIIICLLNSLIFILTVKITEKTTGKFNGTIKGVYKINKDNLEINDSESLKYFYEPKPESTDEITADWLGKTIYITINKDGLNDRFDYEKDKPEDYFRIVTLGDSHTYGLFVQTEENFSEQLEDMLNNQLECHKYYKFEVINLGIFGYDLMYSYERFMRRGIRYNPNLVVWFVNNWNFDKINEYYIPRKKELEKMGYEEFNEENSKYEITDKIYGEIVEKYGNEGFFNYQKKVVDQMVSNYEKKILFISYDDLTDNFENFLENIINTFPELSLFKLSFNSDSRKDLFFIDKHPNQSGHMKIAREIIEILVKNELKECEKLTN